MSGGMRLAFNSLKVDRGKAQFLLIISFLKIRLLVSEGRAEVSGSDAQHMCVDLFVNFVFDEDTLQSHGSINKIPLGSVEKH